MSKLLMMVPQKKPLHIWVTHLALSDLRTRRHLCTRSQCFSHSINTCCKLAVMSSAKRSGVFLQLAVMGLLWTSAIYVAKLCFVFIFLGMICIFRHSRIKPRNLRGPQQKTTSSVSSSSISNEDESPLPRL